MITIEESDVVLKAIRSQGLGGQHVNTTATAIHLSFDIWASDLPEPVKLKLASLQDERISKKGVINIKSQNARSQLQNKLQALQRLNELVTMAQITTKKRIATRPSKGSIRARLDNKTHKGNQKKLRNKQIDMQE